MVKREEDKKKQTQITAYVGLGSNLGDRKTNLQHALAILPDYGCDLIRASSIYETEPQGDPDQTWFVNQVVQLNCPADLSPDLFLFWLLEIENKLGRTRDHKRRFSPRLIDLDLLIFGNCISGHETSSDLILPHPRLKERAFVLVPLQEICPGIILPDGLSVEELLKELPHKVIGYRIYQ